MVFWLKSKGGGGGARRAGPESAFEEGGPIEAFPGSCRGKFGLHIAQPSTEQHVAQGLLSEPEQCVFRSNRWTVDQPQKWVTRRPIRNICRSNNGF